MAKTCNWRMQEVEMDMIVETRSIKKRRLFSMPA